jgi:hypothetical protein
LKRQANISRIDGCNLRHGVRRRSPRSERQDRAFSTSWTTRAPFGDEEKVLELLLSVVEEEPNVID